MLTVVADCVCFADDSDKCRLMFCLSLLYNLVPWRLLCLVVRCALCVVCCGCFAIACCEVCVIGVLVIVVMCVVVVLPVCAVWCGGVFSLLLPMSFRSGVVRCCSVCVVCNCCVSCALFVAVGCLVLFVVSCCRVLYDVAVWCCSLLCLCRWLFLV